MLLYAKREMPFIDQKHPKIPSLSGDFARIQTKVAPQNPYDNIERKTDFDVNNSIDHVKQPTVNPKEVVHQNYSVKNRENELKSILKKSSDRPFAE